MMKKETKCHAYMTNCQKVTQMVSEAYLRALQASKI